MTSYFAQCPDFDGEQHYCALRPPIPSPEEQIRQWRETGLRPAHPQHCHFDVDPNITAATHYPIYSAYLDRIIERGHLKGGSLFYGPPNATNLVRLLETSLNCSVHNTHPKIWRRAEAFHTRHQIALERRWTRNTIIPDDTRPWQFVHVWEYNDPTPALHQLW